MRNGIDEQHLRSSSSSFPLGESKEKVQFDSLLKADPMQMYPIMTGDSAATFEYPTTQVAISSGQSGEEEGGINQ